MPPRHRIDFTTRELDVMVSIVAGINPDLDPSLDRVERAAANRAIDKIERAWRKATTGNAADPDVFCNTCNNHGRDVAGPGGQNFGCSGCGHLYGQHPNRLEARS